MKEKAPDLVRIVIDKQDKGLEIAFSFLDGLIDQRGDTAQEVGGALRQTGASKGDAAAKNGSLMQAIEAEIQALIPTTVDRARLERLSADVTEKRRERDEIAREKREAQRKVVEAEEALIVAGGDPVRAPSAIGIAVVGFVVAALFAAVLTPSVPLLVPGLKDQSGHLTASGQLKAFLIGLGVGAAIVTPSFYAALYHIEEFVVRHGSAIAGLLVVLGIGLIRRFQVGEWNDAVIGLIVIETAVVLFVEVIAGVIRARYKDRGSTEQAALRLSHAKRTLAAMEEAERRADESLEKRKVSFDVEETTVRLVQTLVSRRQDYLNKGGQRVSERFYTGYSTGERMHARAEVE